MASLAHPFLGFGLGLRPQHYQAVLEDGASIDWLEVLTDNYLVPGGKPLHYLARIRVDGRGRMLGRVDQQR